MRSQRVDEDSEIQSRRLVSFWKTQRYSCLAGKKWTDWHAVYVKSLGDLATLERVPGTMRHAVMSQSVLGKKVTPGMGSLETVYSSTLQL